MNRITARSPEIDFRLSPNTRHSEAQAGLPVLTHCRLSDASCVDSDPPPRIEISAPGSMPWRGLYAEVQSAAKQ